MSKTYILEPEVPGNLGPRTRMDRSVHPPRIHSLHFVFDGWLGDQLVESFPCYLVTTELADSLAAVGITGFHLADAEVETSDLFREMYPNRILPTFKWFQIVGTPGRDDVSLTEDHRLAVSQKTLDAIQMTKPAGLDYREAD